MRRSHACARIAAVLVSLAPAIFSQTISTGEVTGAALDSTGRVIVGATIVLKSTDTGESRAIPSDASGAYRFAFVKPGGYEISGSSPGLKSDTGSLIVAVGQVESLDIVLKPEAGKEVVLVTDAAPLLNTDNADIVYTLSNRQLDLLPLPGGDMVGVAYSVPGVVVNNRGGGTGFGSGSFAVGGLGSLSNLFTVNGVDNMDPYLNTNNFGVFGMLLGANEVQEASVIQNGYEGQYGRQAGAQVSYVTKSGANAYHGNLIYTYNGRSMNANDFFRNAFGSPRPTEISHQYAASLGGRVVKDKLFFFADSEGLRNAFPTSVDQGAAAPSPALESYSLRTIEPSQVSFYQKMFALYNNAPGHEGAVPVTTGNGLLQDSSGRLGCGRLAGTPTGTGGVFGVDVSCAVAWFPEDPNQTTEWTLSTRLDYNLSANQRLYFRFKTDQSRLAAANFSDVSPLFSGASTKPDYEGQLNDTWVITPRLVNNFIGAASYNNYHFGVPDLAAALNAFPLRINFCCGVTNSGGLASIGPPFVSPSGYRAGLFQIVDDVSYTAGRHSLKAGVNYRYNRESDQFFSRGADEGLFGFSGLDQFASGVLNPNGGSSYFRNFTANHVAHLRLYNVGAYAQDQWAITPRLKVTASVRFDRTGNPYCLGGCFSRLFSPFSPTNAALSTPYDQTIQAGLSHAFYNIEPIIPQPRASLVYSPAWSKSTVFRGGIGLFYDLYAPINILQSLVSNPPDVFGAGIHTGLVNSGGPGSSPAIAAASANAFQSGFASGESLAQLQQAVAPASFGTPGYFSVPPTLRSPKVLEWSAEIQQKLGVRNVLTVQYRGNHGYDIFIQNPNVNAYADPTIYPNGFAGLPTIPPDPRFAGVTQVTNAGYSNYDGLTTLLRRAFGRGFQGQISYTWSHALDTVSNGGLASNGLGAFNVYTSISQKINPADLRSLNYSNADYDVRHNVTGDFIWEVPVKFKNRWMSAALGGWSVGSKLSAHTGTPFSVVNSGIPGLFNNGAVVWYDSGTTLADLVDPNINTSCGHSAVDVPCFSANQFVPAGSQASLGNLPRNSFRGSGYFNIDSSIYKTVPIGERMRFSFGASAYNLLNHPNFLDPNADVAGGGLGLITGTAVNPSGPYGLFGGPSGRAVVVTGKFAF